MCPKKTSTIPRDVPFYLSVYIQLSLLFTRNDVISEQLSDLFSDECRDKLMILSSDATYFPYVQANVVRAENAGDEAEEVFIQSWLKQN